MGTMSLKEIFKELNDSATVVCHMQPGLEQDMVVSLDSYGSGSGLRVGVNGKCSGVRVMVWIYIQEFIFRVRSQRLVWGLGSSIRVWGCVHGFGVSGSGIQVQGPS